MATQKKHEKESSSKREQEPIELDLGLGKLSVGGLFKGLGNLIELAGKLAEEGGEFKQEKAFTAKGPGGKGSQWHLWRFDSHAGWRQVGLRDFGNIKKTPQGPVV